MTAQHATSQAALPSAPLHHGMVWIAGGSFLMGSNDFYPEEGPPHHVTVDGFWMDRHTVTNEEFARFIAATTSIPTRHSACAPISKPAMENAALPVEELTPSSKKRPSIRCTLL
ncbi:MAG: formylglycine-generating enzyme family protein [Ktedonobacterales bacterium]